MKIVNKCLTLDEFKKYIKGKSFEPNDPNKLLIHHTFRPVQSTWNGSTTIQGLKKYYEGKGWDSAPHIFIAPDGIWLFTDMKYQGIHAGEGNYRSIGIEVVGNYDGAVWTGSIKRNTLGVILALVDELGLEIMKDIRFHREFSKKSCPGKSITKDWLYEKLENYAEEYESVQERLPDVGKTIEDNTNSTITNPIELVTEDTPEYTQPEGSKEDLTPPTTLGTTSEDKPLTDAPVKPQTAPQTVYNPEKCCYESISKIKQLINKTNNMNKFVKDKRVIMFFWNTLGAFLSVLAIYLGELSPEYSIILVPVILSITKYLNTKKKLTK